MDFSAIHNTGNNNQFGASNKGKAPTSPLENIDMTVHQNQICELMVPFGTPRAASIRAFVATYCLNPLTNIKLWVWRKASNWTTVALDSSDEQPKITGTPWDVVHITRRELTKSSDVGTITVRDWLGNILTDDMVPHLNFTPLPMAPGQPDHSGTVAINPASAISMPMGNSMGNPMGNSQMMMAGTPTHATTTMNHMQPANNATSMIPPMFNTSPANTVVPITNNPSANMPASANQMTSSITQSPTMNNVEEQVGILRTTVDGLSTSVARDLVQLEERMLSKMMEAIDDCTGSVNAKINDRFDKLFEKMEQQNGAGSSNDPPATAENDEPTTTTANDACTTPMTQRGIKMSKRKAM